MRKILFLGGAVFAVLSLFAVFGCDFGTKVITDEGGYGSGNNPSPPPSWQSYTVSFVSNSGTSVNDRTTNSLGCITLPSTSRSGFYFGGWWTQNSGGLLAGEAGESYCTNRNVTLYARWYLY